MEIFDNVFLGNRIDAKDALFFKKANILYVLNCTDDLGCFFDKKITASVQVAQTTPASKIKDSLLPISSSLTNNGQDPICKTLQFDQEDGVPNPVTIANNNNNNNNNKNEHTKSPSASTASSGLHQQHDFDDFFNPALKEEPRHHEDDYYSAFSHSQPPLSLSPQVTPVKSPKNLYNPFSFFHTPSPNNNANSALNSPALPITTATASLASYCSPYRFCANSINNNTVFDPTHLISPLMSSDLPLLKPVTPPSALQEIWASTTSFTQTTSNYSISASSSSLIASYSSSTNPSTYTSSFSSYSETVYALSEQDDIFANLRRLEEDDHFMSDDNIHYNDGENEASTMPLAQQDDQNEQTKQGDAIADSPNRAVTSTFFSSTVISASIDVQVQPESQPAPQNATITDDENGQQTSKKKKKTKKKQTANNNKTTPKNNTLKQMQLIEFIAAPTYMRIGISDSHDSNIKAHFDSGANFIAESISKHVVNRFENNTPVRACCLVHCREAKSRSVSMVLAYAMKYKRMKLAEAYDHVYNMKQGDIRINDGFKRQLMEYELEVFPELKENSKNFFPQRERKIRNYSEIPEIDESMAPPKPKKAKRKAPQPPPQTVAATANSNTASTFEAVTVSEFVQYIPPAPVAEPSVAVNQTTPATNEETGKQKKKSNQTTAPKQEENVQPKQQQQQHRQQQQHNGGKKQLTLFEIMQKHKAKNAANQ